MADPNPVEFSAEELVDCLIANWNEWEKEYDYYLSTLVPAIVADLKAAGLTDSERAVAERLRSQLGADKWVDLPELVRDRVSAWRSSCTSDRLGKSLAEWVELEKRERRQRQREEAARRHREQEEVTRRRLEEVEARRKALRDRLKAELQRDFLSARHLVSESESELLSPAEYQDLRREVVSEWAAALRPREAWALDEEQLEAVAATGGDIRVTARAGSGKTRTLVARALFLQTHCKVHPSEILLLAFNRNAAQEMEERIRNVTREHVPHIMTFHALAHALVHPDEELVADDESAGRFGLSRELQEVIDAHLRSDVDGPRVRELMLSHFRDDWERIARRGHDLTMDEFLAARRALPRQTLKGEFVRSYGEKLIANTLFENSVEYKYERNFRWDESNYRPDFTLAASRVVIEYFGLRGDPDYDERTEEKREFWSGMEGWTLLEYFPSDVAQSGPEAFQECLLGSLREKGVEIRRRTEEEIWQLVRTRAIDGFTKAMRTFVGRCRKRDLDDEEAGLFLDSTPPESRAEELFGSLGKSIYRGYLQRLADKGKEDFDGLMWRAIEKVRKGDTSFLRRGGKEQGDLGRLRFIHVDEFQDFSQMFYELIMGVRKWNPGMELFCVGDDWQAINGFAGSELRFVSDFHTLFRKASSLQIATNYRSGRNLVEAGNALMRGRGPAARASGDPKVPGRVLVARLNEFSPTHAEQERYQGDEVTPALLRVLQSFLVTHRRVVILARRRVVPWYVNFAQGANFSEDGLERFVRHLNSYLPEGDRGRLLSSTVHSFKGREEDAVIVVDAVQRSFPLIHPNWVFFRAFGDRPESLLEEERRLLYVAMTRARASLLLLTDALSESPFLRDLDVCKEVGALEWNELPPLAVEAGEFAEIRVSKAYDIRDQLKNRGYRFRRPEAGDPYWWRLIPKAGFDPDKLLREPWIQPGLRIDVLSERQECIYERTTG